MNALPDAYDYTEVGQDAPEPDDCCDWCGTFPCSPDCRPPVTGRSMARHFPRIENGDPES